MWAIAVAELAVLAALAGLTLVMLAINQDLAVLACLAAIAALTGYALCYWPCPRERVPPELIHATTPAALHGGIIHGHGLVHLRGGTRARIRFVPLLGGRPFRPRIYFYRAGTPGWVREFNTPKATVFVRVRTCDLPPAPRPRLYRRPIDGAFAWPAREYTGPAQIELEPPR